MAAVASEEEDEMKKASCEHLGIRKPSQPDAGLSLTCSEILCKLGNYDLIAPGGEVTSTDCDKILPPQIFFVNRTEHLHTIIVNHETTQYTVKLQLVSFPSFFRGRVL